MRDGTAVLTASPERAQSSDGASERAGDRIDEGDSAPRFMNGDSHSGVSEMLPRRSRGRYEMRREKEGERMSEAESRYLRVTTRQLCYLFWLPGTRELNWGPVSAEG